MATYLVLINYTDQGVRNIAESPSRANNAQELARAAGIEVKELLWTIGEFDGALLLEAPDDQAVTAWALKVGSLGNVRTQTLRAFGPEEFQSIVSKLPR